MNKPDAIFVKALVEHARVEDNNFHAIGKRLGTTLLVYEELCKLFTCFEGLFHNPASKHGNYFFDATTNCFQLMFQDLLKCAVCLCRGYTTDASFHTRRSVETAAIMICMIQNPSSASDWIKIEELADIDKYLQHFKIHKVIKLLSHKSQKAYENLCLSVHPSAFSIVPRTRIAEDGSRRIRIFDVRDDSDIPSLRLSFLMHMAIHQSAVGDVVNSLSANQFKIDKWRRACDQFESMWYQNTMELINAGASTALTSAFFEAQSET